MILFGFLRRCLKKFYIIFLFLLNLQWTPNFGFTWLILLNFHLEQTVIVSFKFINKKNSFEKCFRWFLSGTLCSLVLRRCLLLYTLLRIRGGSFFVCSLTLTLQWACFHNSNPWRSQMRIYIAWAKGILTVVLTISSILSLL